MMDLLGIAIPGWLGEVFKGVFLLVVGHVSGIWTKAREFSHSDLKERTDEICKLIETIATDCITYWSENETSASKELGHRIVFNFKRLERLRLFCAERSPAYSGRRSIVEPGDDLEELATGGDFQTGQRIASPRIAAELRDKCDELSMAFRRALREERTTSVPLWHRKRRADKELARRPGR